MQPALNLPIILIVDDDKGLARLIEKAVHREGFSTAVALTGEKALTWLRDHRADLILLDLKLPDYQGPELIAQLETTGCKAPFIIITGQGDERVAVEMMKRGALDYLLKDVQFLEFLPIVVRRALAQLSRERDLKLAEEAYLKEHMFGNAVFEASGAVLIVLDREGRIVRSNRACERVTGYSSSDLSGKPFKHLVGSLSKTELDLSQPEFNALLLNSESEARETTLLTKSGERRVIAWSITPMPYVQAHQGFIIASGVDTTDRRRLEQEILEISDREQRRIGQDMHDGLGQQITASALLSNMLQHSLKDKGLQEAATAQRLGDLLRHAGADVRRISHGLQPVSREPGSLMSGLEKLVADAVAISANCIFHCESPVEVYSNTTANHLYRIAQEGIQNALKHARPKSVIVRLTRCGKDVNLEIEDDGVGFDQALRQTSGIGLGTMNYRAGAINGFLELIRRPQGGTLLRCRAPDPQPVPQNN